MNAGFWERHSILVVHNYVLALRYRFSGVMMFEAFLGADISSHLC